MTQQDRNTDFLDLDQPIPRFNEIAPDRNKRGAILTVKNINFLADFYGITFEYDAVSQTKRIKFPNVTSRSDLANSADIGRLLSLCNMNELKTRSFMKLLPDVFEDQQDRH